MGPFSPPHLIEIDMLTVYYKTSADIIVRHTMDVQTYYCEWRRQWVAYDGNLEPFEDGCFPFYGLGDTREKAIENMIADWEEIQERR